MRGEAIAIGPSTKITETQSGIHCFSSKRTVAAFPAGRSAQTGLAGWVRWE
jgi:hypothetical protein